MYENVKNGYREFDHSGTLSSLLSFPFYAGSTGRTRNILMIKIKSKMINF